MELPLFFSCQQRRQPGGEYLGLEAADSRVYRRATIIAYSWSVSSFTINTNAIIQFLFCLYCYFLVLVSFHHFNNVCVYVILSHFFRFIDMT